MGERFQRVSYSQYERTGVGQLGSFDQKHLELLGEKTASGRREVIASCLICLSAQVLADLRHQIRKSCESLENS